MPQKTAADYENYAKEVLAELGKRDAELRKRGYEIHVEISRYYHEDWTWISREADPDQEYYDEGYNMYQAICDEINLDWSAFITGILSLDAEGDPLVRDMVNCST